MEHPMAGIVINRLKSFFGAVWFDAVLLLAFFALSAGPVSAEKRQVVAAVLRDFPPLYQTGPSGQPEGFAIDILNAVARDADLSVSYLQVNNWGEAMNLLRGGKIDLIPGIGVSPERGEEFLLSGSIETIPVSWFVRTGSHQIQSVADIRGKTVAVLEQGVASEVLASNPDFTLRSYITLEQALFDLLAGNVDAFAFPEPVLKKKAHQIGVENRIRVVGKPLLELKRAYMFKSRDSALKDLLEPHINRFVRSPAYLDAYQRWYGSSSPFWTASRVFWVVTVPAAFLLILMALLRYTAVRRLYLRLKESEDRLRLTTDSLPGSYVYQYTYDPGGKPRFLFLSRGVEEVHPGITVEEILKDASLLHSKIDQDQVPALLAAEAESAKNLSVFSMDLRYHLPSGEEKWFQARSKTRKSPEGQIFWDGAAIDITDRKRAEQALREEKARLSALSSNLADSMVYQVDSGPDGKSRRFSYISPAVEKFHGVTVDAVKNDSMRIYSQVLEEDLAFVSKKEAEAFEKKTSFEADVRVRMPSGDIRWRRFISSPRLSDEGHWIWDGIEVDITERKNLQAQLYQAQKMESVGRLAGGVAHDFNNILGVILGRSEIAATHLAPDHPAQADLEEIRKAAERSAGLTRQLLAFARKQTAVPRILDINETISGMLKMLRHLIGEDIDLIFIPGNEPGRVNMDPSQVDQILANLCVNARDAIPDTGTITIRTSKSVLDESFCKDFPECFPGDYVLLTVSDTGTGMDGGVMEKLFEPFFTTKETGKGTGLGLATVYGIVKQNLGVILVDSAPGQGTTFKIYLPSCGEEAPVGRTEGMTEKPKGGRETILIAEDDPAILRMSNKMLKSLGYRVLPASTPDEAIQTAREYSGDIDLLLTDVVMPGMNGRDLAGRILLSRPDLKVLYMSGYTSDVIAHHGVLETGVRFIQKPFLIHELDAHVRDALDQ